MRPHDADALQLKTTPANISFAYNPGKLIIQLQYCEQATLAPMSQALCVTLWTAHFSATDFIAVTKSRCVTCGFHPMQCKVLNLLQICNRIDILQIKETSEACSLITICIYFLILVDGGF